jgi:hypothetical protein
MMPAAPPPQNAGIKVPVEVKLKSKYRYDSRRHIFESDSGERFKPPGDLPKNIRIVYKVPALAEADSAKLSRHEKELRRYMQVILPESESPADYVEAIRAWPSVEEAWLAPEVSLPMALPGHERSAQQRPVKVSRASVPAIASTADDGSRRANNNDGDYCGDNELGTAWTGNTDCDDGANNKRRQR